MNRTTMTGGAALIGAALLIAAPGLAATNCKVKVDKKTGTIQVSANTVTGSLTWGGTSGATTNAFFNAGTCIAAGKASKCQLAATGTAAAITPPALCTIYVKDSGPEAECAAFIKGCTPGVRSTSTTTRVLPIVKDSNGSEVGAILDGLDLAYNRSTLIIQSSNGLGFAVYARSSGFADSYAFFTTTDCTGPAYLDPSSASSLPAEASVIGTTLYYPAGPPEMIARQSILQQTGTCVLNAGASLAVPAITEAVPAFLPPFHVEFAQ